MLREDRTQGKKIKINKFLIFGFPRLLPCLFFFFFLEIVLEEIKTSVQILVEQAFTLDSD